MQLNTIIYAYFYMLNVIVREISPNYNLSATIDLIWIAFEEGDIL